MNEWNKTNTRPEMLLRVGLLCASLIACGSDQSLGATGAQDSTTVAARTAQTHAIAIWNAIALKTTAAGPFSPPRETRAIAMVSAAVFDAVNSITRQYAPYAVHVVASGDASIEAAVGAAAHHVLVSLYPAQTALLDAVRDSALFRIAAGRTRDDGVATGQTVAAAVLAMRAGDHAAEQPRYAPGVGMGVWVSTPPAFGGALEPGWGAVTPFFMDSSSQFRPGPPPSPGSERYVRDYIEIASVGAANSQARSPTQTEAGRFWISTAAQLWNQVVRQLTVARGLDAAAAARAYLLLNLAGADAAVAAWDAKFTYNQWRPVTAIRNVGDDGSLTTDPDPTWTPLITTPPFPDYPAGHTAFGGAAEQVLSALLGEKPGDLSISSPTAGGATHRYLSFHEIAEEVVNARVWGGVHWRTSATVGRELGRRIGDLALARAPKRLGALASGSSTR